MITAACARGCTIARQHKSECEHTDDGKCRGCLPRRADHGLLCWPCHRRLDLTLHDAPTVDAWLTANLGTGEGARVREDYERSATDGAPVPIKVAVYDQRQVLRDHYAAWTDELCETENLTGPKRHTVATDAPFLHAWLGRIEAWDTIADYWEYLHGEVSIAHALAPWRPALRHCRGIPCPECEETQLVLFGGESDVTCLACRTMITPDRYLLWTRIAAGEWSQGA